MHIAYGQKKVLHAGPTYKSMKIKGDKIVLKFDHTGAGLISTGESIKGFAIAGEDKIFVWANAKIDGKKVIVFNDKVRNPRYVRYGWSDNPECQIYNMNGYLNADHRVPFLPMSPFRTDDLPLLSRDKW